jgi:hypothetical protein
VETARQEWRKRPGYELLTDEGDCETATFGTELIQVLLGEADDLFIECNNDGIGVALGYKFF